MFPRLLRKLLKLIGKPIPHIGKLPSTRKCLTIDWPFVSWMKERMFPLAINGLGAT